VNAEGAASAAPCRALRATVSVRQLRGDTLIFSRIELARDQLESAACRIPGAGYIDLAANPSLQVVTYRRDPQRTTFAGLFSAAGVLGGVVFLAVAYALAMSS
jgi:3-mercaptopyruvate sulfurtransferase SseA